MGGEILFSQLAKIGAELSYLSLSRSSSNISVGGEQGHPTPIAFLEQDLDRRAAWVGNT
jgi:hypothetical protein